LSTRIITARGAQDDCLAGGGELGARMRAIDWSETPLGPVHAWPQSLKTCMRIILTSRQPMFVWWGEELINLYNDAYKAIVGGKHPDALGQPARVVWREIWDQIAPRAATAMRANEGTYDEALLLIMERNGYAEETYYTFSYSPVPNDQGGTGGIICANTDDTLKIISERQLAVLRELATRTADVRTQGDLFGPIANALATNARDLPFAMVYLGDTTTRVAKLCTTVGIARGSRAAPESLAFADGACWPLAAALRTNEPTIVEDLERRCGRVPSGAWERAPTRAAILPLAFSGQSTRVGFLVVGLNPFRLFDEAYRGFLGLVAGQIAASMANTQAYEDEKKRAEALAELDRAKTAFFSNVSHEFRTPLTLMLGPVEDSLRNPSSALPPEERERLALVLRNGQRLQKLVNTLLDFARIEAGRTQASYEPTDLAKLTNELASAFEAAIARGGLRYEVECAPLPQLVFIDHDMWEKIVLNLLSNAFKFTFEGSIRVVLRATASHAELVVSDTGSGIPPAELPHLFERFHRVQGARSRTHEGSGIGLALVHELVRLHGGEIRVTSELGRGTTFVVAIPFGSRHLPQERVGATRAQTSTALGAAPFVNEALRWLPNQHDEATNDASLPASIPPERGARVLLADDNADMRDYVRRLLSDRWHVDVVPDGEAALEAVRRHPPDVIVSDVMMPVLDGFALLRALRSDPRTRDIPVIMLSARSGEESRIEGLEAGANDYLVKPFSARELIARVQTQLTAVYARKLDEQTRERITRLLTHAPVAMAMLKGREHTFELTNAQYQQLIANRPVLGKSIRQAFPELEGQGIYELLDTVFATGEPQTRSELTVKLAGASGALEDRSFTFIYQPIFDASAGTEGILVVALDETKHVHARQQIEEANQEAQRASRAKDEFLAMLGHELRNPLAPILTALQLMRLRGGTGAEKERAVIERQVNHVVRLVDDLLDVSRITRGKVDLRKQHLEIAEAVAKAIEVASPLLEQRQHRLTVNVPQRGLVVDADPARLAQVISNLLTNAAKYTEPNGAITIDASSDGDEVVLEVRDTGIGISSDLLPRVFDLFWQEPQALDRSQGGLGLGLAIVRTLVSVHGGTISAHSEGRGHGSEFTLRLPLVERGRATVPQAQEPAARAATHDGKRVLIVDDNVDAAEMLGFALESMGCTIQIAHDGPSALRVAQRFVADIALLDIGLPVMDGYELARRLRELPGFAQTHLVAVTGYGQQDDRRRSSEAGFNAHLVKPVEIEAIAEVVRGTS
jgi:signal transduction histidine kinase/CheY-like chemotaxis protein